MVAVVAEDDEGLVNGFPMTVVARDGARVVVGLEVTVVCRVMKGAAVDALYKGLTVVVVVVVVVELVSSKL